MKTELNGFIEQYQISGKDSVEVDWSRFNVIALPYPSLTGTFYSTLLSEHEYAHVYLINSFDKELGTVSGEEAEEQSEYVSKAMQNIAGQKKNRVLALISKCGYLVGYAVVGGTRKQTFRMAYHAKGEAEVVALNPQDAEMKLRQVLKSRNLYLISCEVKK